MFHVEQLIIVDKMCIEIQDKNDVNIVISVYLEYN